MTIRWYVLYSKSLKAACGVHRFEKEKTFIVKSIDNQFASMIASGFQFPGTIKHVLHKVYIQIPKDVRVHTKCATLYLFPLSMVLLCANGGLFLENSLPAAGALE